MKALQKKLRQMKALQDRVDAGEALDDGQKLKLSSRPDIEKELADVQAKLL